MTNSVIIHGGNGRFLRPWSRTRWNTLGRNGQKRSSLHREHGSPSKELISFGRRMGWILRLPRRTSCLVTASSYRVYRKKCSALGEGLTQMSPKRARACRDSTVQACAYVCAKNRHVCQELRYLRCNRDRLSILRPKAANLCRATSMSMSSGTFRTFNGNLPLFFERYSAERA
jgi:hypothetical protein